MTTTEPPLRRNAVTGTSVTSCPDPRSLRPQFMLSCDSTSSVGPVTERVCACVVAGPHSARTMRRRRNQKFTLRLSLRKMLTQRRTIATDGRAIGYRGQPFTVFRIAEEPKILLVDDADIGAIIGVKLFGDQPVRSSGIGPVLHH